MKIIAVDKYDELSYKEVLVAAYVDDSWCQTLVNVFNNAKYADDCQFYLQAVSENYVLERDRP